MKKTVKNLKNNLTSVTLEFENGKKFEFKYDRSSAAMLDFVEEIVEASENDVSDAESQEAVEAGLEMYRLIKRVIGRKTYRQLADFAEDQGEPLSAGDVMQILWDEKDLEELAKQSEEEKK